MERVIETHDLTKRYGARTAVDALNLTVNEGEVFGFLGPNGAGKSTTILMLLGLTEPSAGSASVVGLDPVRDARAVKRFVGCMPENVGFYDELTGRENLRYVARLNEIPDAEAEPRIEDLLEKVRLAEDADRPVSQYSRGMRQRLGIAEVLVKDPRLIILDEPTLGLDPEGIESMNRMIRDLSREKGITVLLCSHLLYQVEKVCDRVGILDRGRLVTQGTLAEIAGGQLSLEDIYRKHFQYAEA